MELILIRHGQSKGNANDIVQGHLDEGLSDLGLEQAESLSKFFNPGDLTAIYSSDLDRAKQTAEPTSKKLSLEINLDPELREAGFGIWEGMTFTEVKEKYKEEYSNWHKNYYIRPPWFESFESHHSRIRKAIERIISSYKTGDKIGIFCHGGSIKTQVGFFKKLNGEELTKISILNCSLTGISYNSSKNYEDGNMIFHSKDVIKSMVRN